MKRESLWKWKAALLALLIAGSQSAYAWHGLAHYYIGEHNTLMKSTLWERGTRIPLIIKVPGMEDPGVQTDSPVSLVDLYPTIAELAECGNIDELDVTLDGHSLTSILDDPDAELEYAVGDPVPALTSYIDVQGLDPDYYLESYHAVCVKHADPDYTSQDALYRYIRYSDTSLRDVDDDVRFAPEFLREELYNLDNDPLEMKNLLRGAPPDPKYVAVADDLDKSMAREMRYSWDLSSDSSGDWYSTPAVPLYSAANGRSGPCPCLSSPDIGGICRTQNGLTGGMFIPSNPVDTTNTAHFKIGFGKITVNTNYADANYALVPIVLANVADSNVSQVTGIIQFSSFLAGAHVNWARFNWMNSSEPADSTLHNVVKNLGWDTYDTQHPELFDCDTLNCTIQLNLKPSVIAENTSLANIPDNKLRNGFFVFGTLVLSLDSMPCSSCSDDGESPIQWVVGTPKYELFEAQGTWEPFSLDQCKEPCVLVNDTR